MFDNALLAHSSSRLCCVVGLVGLAIDGNREIALSWTLIASVWETHSGSSASASLPWIRAQAFSIALWAAVKCSSI